MLDLAFVILLLYHIVGALRERHWHIVRLLDQRLRLLRRMLLRRARRPYRPSLGRLILAQRSLLDQSGDMIIAAVFEWRDAALAIGLLGRESLASLGELDLLGRVYVHHVLQLLLELLVVLRGLPQ